MAFTVLQAAMPVQAALGATTTTMLGDVPSAEAQGSFVVSKLSVTSPSLVTGGTLATTSVTISFRQMRAGASVATIGSLAVATPVTLPAEVEVNVPITGTPALLPGDTIDVQCVQSATTGLALPAGVIAKAELA